LANILLAKTTVKNCSRDSILPSSTHGPRLNCCDHESTMRSMSRRTYGNNNNINKCFFFIANSTVFIFQFLSGDVAISLGYVD